jgi:hypothetical protein
MSAFFVQEGTIDNVIELMRPSAMSGDEVANRFGRELLEMNAESLRQRYDLDGTDELKDYLKAAANYVYVEPKTSDAQKLKSIGCLTYQCCEGDVDQTPLYKRVAKAETNFGIWLGLAPDQSGSTLKGYNEAEWDYFRK